MPRRLGFAFLLIVSGLSLSAIGLQAQAGGRDCSYLVVNRSYAHAFGGFLNAPAYFAGLGVPAPPGAGLLPNAGAGSLTFLPNGKFVNKETLAIGQIGVTEDLLISGTYSLLWDTSKSPAVCTGSLNGTGMVSGAPMPFTFQLVVSNDGDRIEMVHTDAGLIVTTTSLPMRPWGCSNTTLAGSYLVNAEGWMVAPSAVPTEQTLSGYMPFAFSGGMKFRWDRTVSKTLFPDSPAGSAQVEEWDTVSVNGQIVARTSIGWFKVNRDCTGTLVLRDSLGNPDFHLRMLIGKDAEAVHLVNTDTVPGSAIPLFTLGTTLHSAQGGWK